MISSRHQALIDQELEPDMKLQHQGAVGMLKNGIGDHNRWWSLLTPEEQERFKKKEREFKTKRDDSY